MSVDARAASKRALLVLALQVLALHVALLAAWPLVRPVFAPAFRVSVQFALGLIDPLPGPIDAVFEPGSGGILAVNLPQMDTEVHLRHRTLGGADASFGASSYFHAWVPTTVLLALFVAAAPLPWSTRRWRLALALALLFAFVALRCAVAAYYCYSKCNVDGVPLVDLGPNAARALFLGWDFVFGEDFPNYVVPITLWALAVFGGRSRGEPDA